MPKLHETVSQLLRCTLNICIAISPKLHRKLRCDTAYFQAWVYLYYSSLLFFFVLCSSFRASIIHNINTHNLIEVFIVIRGHTLTHLKAGHLQGPILLFVLPATRLQYVSVEAVVRKASKVRDAEEISGDAISHPLDWSAADILRRTLHRPAISAYTPCMQTIT